ncbi:MAG: 30S ribosomal protein S16 [Chitinivibrionales bacterium]|nr:30S ribosomal protein S16 [Chitinivibrionales bacterium]MBD3356949.1 30S ribosomal protein S16 [Chitinivibrionales bacterium]
MAVKIRLARVGRKKVARYRVVAIDSRARRDGRSLEMIGSYNPEAEPKEFSIKYDRLAYWLNQGAEPSLTVHNLLKQDRAQERIEAAEKGLDPSAANIERKPERKRKPKPKKGKESS